MFRKHFIFEPPGVGFDLNIGADLHVEDFLQMTVSSRGLPPHYRGAITILQTTKQQHSHYCIITDIKFFMLGIFPLMPRSQNMITPCARITHPSTLYSLQQVQQACSCSHKTMSVTANRILDYSEYGVLWIHATWLLHIPI